MFVQWLRYPGLAALALATVLLAACSDSGSPVDQGGTGNIAGSVFNPASNEGVPGITVRAESTASGSHTTSTNQAGGFTFVGVATGGWSLTIDVPGGMQYASSETGVRTVTVRRGETANTQAFNIVQVAQLEGAITGRVTTADGTPVAGAALTILNAGPSEPSTTTDGSGNYGFTGLSAQVYGLEITPPAGYQLPAGQPAQRTVAVEPGQTATLNWTLQASGGSNLSAVGGK